jgi:hypothetical protein
MPLTEQDIFELQSLLSKFGDPWATYKLSDFIEEQRLLCNHKLVFELKAAVSDHPELQDLTIRAIQEELSATQPNWRALELDGAKDLQELQHLLRDANMDQMNWTVSKFIDACVNTQEGFEDTADIRKKGDDILDIVTKRPFLKLKIVWDILHATFDGLKLKTV